MKILVLGCGYIGPAVAHYLVSQPSVKQVALVDNQASALEKAENKFSSLICKKMYRSGPGMTESIEDLFKNKLRFLKYNLSALNDFLHLFKEYDLIAAALPWSSTLPAIHAANDLNKPLISITRPSYPDLDILKKQTEASNNIIVLGCGLEPGLTEILAAHAVANLDIIDELHIRCGGLPLQANPPLYYKSLFNSSNLPIEPRLAYAIQAGKLISLPRFSGIEALEIDNLGSFEAWHDGMLPWLADWPSLRKAKNVTQKTVRWPGFAQTIQTLASLGLLSKDTIEVNQQSTIPFNVVNAVLRKQTESNECDRDFVVLNIQASGSKSGKKCQYLASLVDRYDETTQFTAMARTTGFTLGILAMMIAQGKVQNRGLLQPEEIFSNASFNHLQMELQKLGVTLKIQLKMESIIRKNIASHIGLSGIVRASS